MFSCHVISREMESASIVLKKVNFLELFVGQNYFVHRAITER